MIYINKIVGNTTPHNMISIYYDRAKLICQNMWDKPSVTFEDIYHDTLYRCLNVLGDKEYSKEYLRAYLFKAFRCNMIRYYGYAYNRLKSGAEIENVLIKSEEDLTDRMDGILMLEYVKNKHGDELHNMLFDNIHGMTYTDLDKKYNINTYYYLSKLKDELKRMYVKEIDKKKILC